MIRSLCNLLRGNASFFVRRKLRDGLLRIGLIAACLVVTGGTYSALLQATAFAEQAPASESQIAQGHKLFIANCATCHGLNGEGTQYAPSLVGAGAASADFQLSSGRMPLRMNGPQALYKPPQYTKDEMAAIVAYVASLGPGPAIPEEKYLTPDGDLVLGAELFKVNCAACHNVAGAGGALTEGKFAPRIINMPPVRIYEAMLTGPQSMPIFNDASITPEQKRDIITYLHYLSTQPSPGGFGLGSLGPVAEGLFAWVFLVGGITAFAVWIAARSD